MAIAGWTDHLPCRSCGTTGSGTPSPASRDKARDRGCFSAATLGRSLWWRRRAGPGDGSGNPGGSPRPGGTRRHAFTCVTIGCGKACAFARLVDTGLLATRRRSGAGREDRGAVLRALIGPLMIQAPSDPRLTNRRAGAGSGRRRCLLRTEGDSPRFRHCQFRAAADRLIAAGRVLAAGQIRRPPGSRLSRAGRRPWIPQEAACRRAPPSRSRPPAAALSSVGAGRR